MTRALVMAVEGLHQAGFTNYDVVGQPEVDVVRRPASVSTDQGLP